MSFLEVKYELLLSYVTNLVYLMTRKIHGKSITERDTAKEGTTTIDRIVEIRTVYTNSKVFLKPLQMDSFMTVQTDIYSLLVLEKIF